MDGETDTAHGPTSRVRFDVASWLACAPICAPSSGVPSDAHALAFLTATATEADDSFDAASPSSNASPSTPAISFVVLTSLPLIAADSFRTVAASGGGDAGGREGGGGGKKGGDGGGGRGCLPGGHGGGLGGG
eukprot:1501722-Prymnesium_polylepis.1